MFHAGPAHTLGLSRISSRKDALRIYGALREQSHNRVPGAQPTEHELEMDFKRLIKGKADGEMLVEHESPHISGGVHTVVDDVHKHSGKAYDAAKETIQ